MELIDLLYFIAIGANIILGSIVLLRGRPSSITVSFSVLAFFMFALMFEPLKGWIAEGATSRC